MINYHRYYAIVARDDINVTDELVKKMLYGNYSLPEKLYTIELLDQTDNDDNEIRKTIGKGDKCNPPLKLNNQYKFGIAAKLIGFKNEKNNSIRFKMSSESVKSIIINFAKFKIIFRIFKLIL